MEKIVGRPKSFDEDKVLALAMNYFWEHGYDNSSLDDLLLAMGIKKSSFYHAFKNKEELFSRSLELYRNTLLRHIEAVKSEAGPKAALLSLGNIVLSELKESGKVKGCLLMNSSKECYNRYSELSRQIRIEFNFMLGVIEKFVKEAQEKGEISTKKDAKQIAGRYLSAFNGLIISIQAGASKETIDDLSANLRELLE